MKKNFQQDTSDVKIVMSDIDKKIEQLRLQLAELEKEKKFQEDKARKIKILQEQTLLTKQNIDQLKLETKEQQAKLDKHTQEIELAYKELQKLEACKENLEKNIKKAMENLEQKTKELKLSEEQLRKIEAEQYLVSVPREVKSEKEYSL